MFVREANHDVNRSSLVGIIHGTIGNYVMVLGVCEIRINTLEKNSFMLTCIVQPLPVPQTDTTQNHNCPFFQHTDKQDSKLFILQ